MKKHYVSKKLKLTSEEMRSIVDDCGQPICCDKGGWYWSELTAEEEEASRVEDIKRTIEYANSVLQKVRFR